MQSRRVHRDRHTHLDRCPVIQWHGDPCGKPSHAIAPFAICADHARELYEAYDGYIGRASESDLFRAYAALEWTKDARKQEARDALRDESAIVYYVQVDQHIKIGFTTDLPGRMRSYPPHRRLLATEQGGRSVEVQRHRQFGRLLHAGQEWFRPGDDLITHINDLRAAQGAAPIPVP